MSNILTVVEVAHIFRVDDNTVRRWIRIGILDAIVLPRADCSRPTYRIRRQEIDKFMPPQGAENIQN